MVEDEKTKAEASEEQVPEQVAAGEAAAADTAAEAGQESGPAEIDDVEVLKAELEAARQAAEQANDHALRVAAEAQNLRRRAEKDAENARKFALEKFAGDLLAVVDNLERGLEALDRDNEALKPVIEGIELTHKSFLDTLGRHGVAQLNPVGEPFDPQFHEAISMVDRMVENPDAGSNAVVHVMQKGYTLNGRLLRAAMVVVAK